MEVPAAAGGIPRATDHVVGPGSIEVIRAELGSEPTARVCADSYHVATLDHDAGTIFAESLRFVQRLTTAWKGAAE